jgi:hypothetical protein
MISVNIIDDHPCPVCGHKIGMHTNSPFGHNPTIDNVPTGESALECNRSYNSLLIEKLTSWWNDAMSERDAYAKSYEEASESSSNYFDAFLNMTTVASNAAQDRDMYRKKLDIAIDLLDRLSYWDMLWLGEGLPSLVADGPYWKEQIDKTLEKLRK